MDDPNVIRPRFRPVPPDLSHATGIFAPPADPSDPIIARARHALGPDASPDAIQAYVARQFQKLYGGKPRVKA